MGVLEFLFKYSSRFLISEHSEQVKYQHTGREMPFLQENWCEWLLYKVTHDTK